MWRVIKLLFGIYDPRQELANECEREFGKDYIPKFMSYYDEVRKGKTTDEVKIFMVQTVALVAKQRLAYRSIIGHIHYWWLTMKEGSEFAKSYYCLD